MAKIENLVDTHEKKITAYLFYRNLKNFLKNLKYIELYIIKCWGD